MIGKRNTQLSSTPKAALSVPHPSSVTWAPGRPVADQRPGAPRSQFVHTRKLGRAGVPARGSQRRRVSAWRSSARLLAAMRPSTQPQYLAGVSLRARRRCEPRCVRRRRMRRPGIGRPPALSPLVNHAVGPVDHADQSGAESHCRTYATRGSGSAGVSCSRSRCGGGPRSRRSSSATDPVFRTARLCGAAQRVGGALDRLPGGRRSTCACNR
jgi:hypothetical protein